MNIHIPDVLKVDELRIRRFVDAMIYKLKLRAPDKKGFNTSTIETYLSKLKLEIEELEEAVAEGNHLEITLEAADVANFAMLLSVTAIEGENDAGTS